MFRMRVADLHHPKIGEPDPNPDERLAKIIRGFAEIGRRTDALRRQISGEGNK
jgi:hypothetical protein